MNGAGRLPSPALQAPADEDEVMDPGSLKAPPVGMIAGSKLRGSLAAFSHFNFNISSGRDELSGFG